MKFRFTAGHFQKALEGFRTGSGGMKLSDYCAEVANALLEAEEAKCERVYGTVLPDLHYWHSEKGDKDHTHRARVVCI